eukprot:GDKJ01004566.1.p1 GENE.GDKJ01004566.1~~GDKJ01004566.1.p1  ORF type:complete len:965 (+),score=283.48 GDKJ01004566.1:118-2895(+)
MMNVSSPEDGLNLFCLDENKLPDDHDKNEINPESPAVKRSAVNTPSDDENDILPSKRSRLNNESSINRMIDAKDHQISEICSNSENVLFHSDSNHQFSSTSFSSPHSSIFDLPVSKNVIVFDVTNGDVIATKTTSSSNQQPSSHSRKPSSFQNPTAQTNFNSIHDHPSPFAPQLVPSTLSPPSSSKQHSTNHSVTLPNHLHETECMLRVASPSHYEERTAAKQPSTFVHDHAHEFVGVANYLSSTSNDHSAFSFSQELSQRDATRLMQRHETGATACDSSLDHSQHSHHHRDPSSKIQIFDVMPTSCDKNLMLSSSSCEQMDLEGGDERGKERREADEELALEAFLFGDAPSTFPSVSSLIPQPEEEEDSEEEEDEEGGGSESRVSLLFPPQTLHHAVESTVIQLQSNSNISNNNSSSKLTPLQIMSNDPSAVSVSFRASPMPIRSILKRPSLIKKAVCVASPLLSSSPIASKIVPVSLSIDHEEEQFFFQPSGEKQISTDALDGLQPSSTTVYPPSWSKVFLPTVNASSVASDARTKKKERKSQSANESDDEDEELGEVNNNNNNCDVFPDHFNTLSPDFITISNTQQYSESFRNENLPPLQHVQIHHQLDNKNNNNMIPFNNNFDLSKSSHYNQVTALQSSLPFESSHFACYNQQQQQQHQATRTISSSSSSSLKSDHFIYSDDPLPAIDNQFRSNNMIHSTFMKIQHDSHSEHGQCTLLPKFDALAHACSSAIHFPNGLVNNMTSKREKKDFSSSNSNQNLSYQNHQFFVDSNLAGNESQQHQFHPQLAASSMSDFQPHFHHPSHHLPIHNNVNLVIDGNGVDLQSQHQHQIHQQQGFNIQQNRDNRMVHAFDYETHLQQQHILPMSNYTNDMQQTIENHEHSSHLQQHHLHYISNNHIKNTTSVENSHRHTSYSQHQNGRK